MKQKIILCGGPDRCGKTNILQELSNRTLIPYFKAKDEHKNFLYSQNNFINELRFADPRTIDFLSQTGYSVLVDRAYMCEWVYSRFFNRKTDEKMLSYIDEEYSKLGAQILICTRKSFVGIQDDLNPKIDQYALEKISNLYNRFMYWTKCKTFKIYVDNENLNQQIIEISNKLKLNL